MCKKIIVCTARINLLVPLFGADTHGHQLSFGAFAMQSWNMKRETYFANSDGNPILSYFEYDGIDNNNMDRGMFHIKTNIYLHRKLSLPFLCFCKKLTNVTKSSNNLFGLSHSLKFTCVPRSYCCCCVNERNFITCEPNQSFYLLTADESWV